MTGLCTLAEAKAQLNKSGTFTGDDVELQAYIDSVTSAIEEYKGEVAQRTKVEVHEGRGDTIVLRSERVVSITSVIGYLATTAYPFTAAADLASGTTYGYYLDPSGDPILRRLSAGGYQSWGMPVTVTYVAGYATVPPNINLAARFLVQSLWESQAIRAGQQAGTDPLEVTTSLYEGVRSGRIRELLGPARESGIG